MGIMCGGRGGEIAAAVISTKLSSTLCRPLPLDSFQIDILFIIGYDFEISPPPPPQNVGKNIPNEER